MSNVGQPLRRSRRGQKQAYGPGDRVEVVRDEGVAIGRLVRKVDPLSDSSRSSQSNVVHWIVSFEGDAEEQEVTEKYIGRLVESSETDSVKSNQTPVPPKGKKAKSAKASKKTSKSPPRKVKFTSPAKDKQIKDESRPSTRSAVRQGGNGKALLKGIKPAKKTPRGGRKALGENETVVKVKMLTGTLYLYRGPNPRAEFIRTV